MNCKNQMVQSRHNFYALTITKIYFLNGHGIVFLTITNFLTAQGQCIDPNTAATAQLIIAALL